MKPSGRSGRSRAGGLAVAALLAFGAAAGAARAQVLPSRLDKTRAQLSARGLALGGVRTVVLDDAAAAAFNPALIANTGRGGLSVQASARNNIPYWDAVDFVDDLKDVAAQIRDDPSQIDFSGAQASFDALYDFAEGIAGNVAAGRAVTGRVSVSPLVGVSAGNVGVVAYGGIAGIAVLTPGVGTGPREDKRTLGADAGFVQLGVVAVPYAFRAGDGHAGVSAKWTRAEYTAVGFFADASNRALTGRRYDDVTDDQPDLDVGYLSDPIPLDGSTPPEGGEESNAPSARFGGAVRNLLSPKFSLPGVVLGEATVGDPAPVPDFTFRLRPEVDLGGSVGARRWLAALELHNVTGANGGELSVHVGGEYHPVRWLSLRAGYDRDQFVYGAGLALGALRLDLAAGTEPRELLSVGLGARF